MDLNPASKELKRAKNCFERMISAKSYEEFDEFWGDYLGRIENIFTKINIACSSNKKFPGFISRANYLRNNDELLVYLKQARNTVHHGIENTSKKIPGRLIVEQADKTKPIKINSFTLTPSEFKMSSEDAFLVMFTPEAIEAVACKCRGITYQPPTSHLGKKLISRSPIVISELGISFYEELLTEIEKKFK